jgi:hypothetical protein
MDEKRVMEPQEETDLRDTTVGDRDVDLGVIVKFGAGLLAATVLVSVAVWYFSKLLKSDLVAQDPAPSAIVAANPPEAAPGPRLQSDPNEDMAKLRGEEAAALTTYAWLAADKTVARIPIDRAMEILLASGLPKGMGGTPATPETRAAEGAGGPPLASRGPAR